VDQPRIEVRLELVVKTNVKEMYIVIVEDGETIFGLKSSLRVVFRMPSYHRLRGFDCNELKELDWKVFACGNILKSN
jgi:hypothetical protein